MARHTITEQIRFNDNIIKQLCNDPRYTIHPCGKIETTVQKTGWPGPIRLLSFEVKRDGYIRVRYRYFKLNLHRIVYQKFVGDLDPLLQINHKDGNKKNNHFSNLEQVTQSENMFHLFRVLKKTDAANV